MTSSFHLWSLEESGTQGKPRDWSAKQPGSLFDSAAESLWPWAHCFPSLASAPVFSPVQEGDRIACRCLLPLKFCVSARRASCHPGAVLCSWGSGCDVLPLSVLRACLSPAAIQTSPAGWGTSLLRASVSSSLAQG